MVHRKKLNISFVAKLKGFCNPKICYICGKKITCGRFCRRCFSKYASPEGGAW